ncbi:cytochrome c [Bradyrhizobium sp. WD16]|uniref:c-type cytochrome n=1 Tax=Bradyrhizobium sp. WD16 TaxID=1521768 RepID=UPI0020A3C093|nr:cytochrome c [Bradyrhizobium sp. WD16]UTD28209.1 alcohol dehydrogenase [Bradyrhizobium sp. WD16]
MTRRGVLATILLVLAPVLAATFAVYRPEIPPIARKDLPAPDPALLRRGAELAALGDCATCHTAPRGKAFAGGLAIPTPFGTIHSTNITPDDDTGIGRWSEIAFRRAMREGIDREGRHLYPAFPYDHFTLVSDDDNRALYAYLMTRTAVQAPAQTNALPFPLTFRPLLAGWKLLFLRKGPVVSDPLGDAVLNRGAYLVEGIGHCGACHTPRNLFGAERSDQAFAGGDAEGWRAFTINAASSSPVPWNEDSLYAYLRRGWHGLHGVARGPMAPVADNLATVPDADVRAIAAYVAAQIGRPSPDRERQGDELVARVADRADAPGARPQSAGGQTVAAQPGGNEGAAIYAGACATCHDAGRPVPYGGLNLALSTAVSADTPRNFVNVVLGGVAPAEGKRGPIMPPFAATLSDDRIVALSNEVRRRFAHKSAWPDLAPEIAAARQTVTVEGVGSAAIAPDDSQTK